MAALRRVALVLAAVLLLEIIDTVQAKEIAIRNKDFPQLKEKRKF